MGKYNSQNVRGIGNDLPIMGGSWSFTTDGLVKAEEMPDLLRDKINELMEILALVPNADTATLVFSNLKKQRQYQDSESDA